MKRVFPVILTLLLLTACVENQPARVAMEQATALMETRPDSALGILLALPEEDSAAMTKEQRMRWLLLRQQGMNKCDTVFRSDRIPLILVKWFDHHGTPNEQMLAHYLLGRAYADMGESPAALQEYYTAASCADTTAADCDFSTLSRVHGQAGGLFYEQYLPHNSQEEFEKAAYYSWRLGDSLSYYLYCGQLVGTYYQLGDTAQLVSTCEYARRGFQRLGLKENAARVVSTAIHTYLRRGQIEKAKQYIDEIEKEVLPNQSESRFEGAFCSYKGALGLATGNYDSALVYYRRQFNLNDIRQNRISGSKGLYRAYKALHNTDSAGKYMEIYCYENDSSNIFNSAQLLESTYGLYNYERFKVAALHQEQVNERKNRWLLFMGFSTVVLALLFFFLFGNYKRKQERRLQATNQDYVDALTAYQALASEIKILKMTSAVSEALIRQKEDSAGELERVLANSQTDEAGPGEWKEGQEVFSNTVVMTLHKMAVRGVKITDEDLIADIFSFVNSNIPGFLAEIEGRHGNLRQQHRLVCVLTRLRFVPSEISTLLGLSPSSLSNLRRRLLRKLFHEEGPAFRFDERIRQLE